MAAHPFGPIESFLLRGFKNLANVSSVPKVEFHSTKRVLVPNFEDDPIWVYSTAQEFKLEKTAIVNSSDYEVRWIPRFDPKESLSRGLGYRITFTMPADKEFNIQTLVTWPQVEIDFLDTLGRPVANNPKQYLANPKMQLSKSWWENKKSLLKLVSKFKSLMVEQTLFQLKVVENKSH